MNSRRYTKGKSRRWSRHKGCLAIILACLFLFNGPVPITDALAQEDGCLAATSRFNPIAKKASDEIPDEVESTTGDAAIISRIIDSAVAMLKKLESNISEEKDPAQLAILNRSRETILVNLSMALGESPSFDDAALELASRLKNRPGREIVQAAIISAVASHGSFIEAYITAEMELGQNKNLQAVALGKIMRAIREKNDRSFDLAAIANNALNDVFQGDRSYENIRATSDLIVELVKGRLGHILYPLLEHILNQLYEVAPLHAAVTYARISPELLKEAPPIWVNCWFMLYPEINRDPNNDLPYAMAMLDIAEALSEIKEVPKGLVNMEDGVSINVDADFIAEKRRDIFMTAFNIVADTEERAKSDAELLDTFNAYLKCARVAEKALAKGDRYLFTSLDNAQMCLEQIRDPDSLARSKAALASAFLDLGFERENDLDLFEEAIDLVRSTHKNDPEALGRGYASIIKEMAEHKEMRQKALKLAGDIKDEVLRTGSSCFIMGEMLKEAKTPIRCDSLERYVNPVPSVLERFAVEAAITLYLKSVKMPVSDINLHINTTVGVRDAELCFDRKWKEEERWVVPCTVGGRKCEIVVGDDKTALDVRDDRSGGVIPVDPNDVVKLPKGNPYSLEAMLGVCLAVAGYNTKTGERVLAHIVPERHIFLSGDTASAKKEYLGRLLKDFRGPEWRIAVISSTRDPEMRKANPLNIICARDITGYLKNVNGINAEKIQTDENERQKIVLFDASRNVTVRCVGDRRGIKLALNDDRISSEDLAQSLKGSLASLLFNEKVILAFEDSLARQQDQGPLRKLLDALRELRENPAYEKILKNLIIVSAPADKMSEKLKEHTADGNAKVFLFASDKMREGLAAVESEAASAVYIDDNEFHASSYYPIAEIVVIALAQYRDSLIAKGDKVKALTIDGKALALEGINIESLSIDEKGTLIVRLLPKAQQHEPGDLVRRYAAMRQFLEAA